jgi:hypothetical protein
MSVNTNGVALGMAVCLAIVVGRQALRSYFVSHLPDKNPRPSEKDRQVDGLKSLADWSKWIVSIQIALVGGLVVAVFKGKGLENYANCDLLVAALICFLGSIFAATMLLGAIPAALERVPIRTARVRRESDDAEALNRDCDMYSFEFLGFQIRLYAGIQGPLFLAGLFLGLFGFLSC